MKDNLKNNFLANFDELSKKNDKAIDLVMEVEKECEDWLKKVLEEQPNKQIDIAQLAVNGTEYVRDYLEYEVLCVCYDGGNHPEYNTNVNSQVLAIYLNKANEIMLDTEDEDDYSLKRAMTATGGNTCFMIADFVAHLI